MSKIQNIFEGNPSEPHTRYLVKEEKSTHTTQLSPTREVVAAMFAAQSRPLVPQDPSYRQSDLPKPNRYKGEVVKNVIDSRRLVSPRSSVLLHKYVSVCTNVYKRLVFLSAVSLCDSYRL